MQIIFGIVITGWIHSRALMSSNDEAHNSANNLIITATSRVIILLKPKLGRSLACFPRYLPRHPDWSDFSRVQAFSPTVPYVRPIGKVKKAKEQLSGGVYADGLQSLSECA